MKYFFAVAVLGSLCASVALATPEPPAHPESTEPEIALWISMKNLVGPNDEQSAPVGQMLQWLEDTNQIWSQCHIRFVPREVVNVSSSDLKVPFEPQSQADLGKILTAIHPSPRVTEGMIPLILAGKWGFYDPQTKIHLAGIGWQVVNGKHLERLGALVDGSKMHPGMAGYLIGHELGHALSLEHIKSPNNVMSAGTKIMPAQCEQARKFSEMFLQDFTVRAVGSTRSSPSG